VGDIAVSDEARLIVDEPVPTTIKSSPQSITRYPSQSAMFSVSATGSGTLTYQWFRDGLPLSGATNATFTVTSVSATDAGAYTVTVSNGLDSATSTEARLVVKEVPAISARNGGPAFNLGGAATLDLDALEGEGFTYQWFKDGAAVAGATGSSLSLSGVTSADAGSYGVVISNSAGSVASRSFDLTVNVIRLSNLSIRARSGAGDRLLIAGFVVEGSISKPMLVRGVGPTLVNYGVTDPLVDPVMTLYCNVGGEQQPQASNDNWGASNNATEIAAAAARLYASELGRDSLDAVLLPTLSGGVYSALVPGKNDSEGIALAEVFDGDLSEERTRFVNVSARCQVAQGDDVLIAGFVVSGPGQLRLLIRGVGPTLTSQNVSGALADPQITLHQMVQPESRVIATANDWSSEANVAEIESVSTRVHAFPLPSGSKDAAMLVSLSDGVYTVVMSGVNESTGVGLIEVYVVP
ncbi:MAG TPA: immunoglobulin domain-containing protein, partial [Opitutaceae bacterium]